eukprot:7127784-Prymnesium_polylepis.3
MAIKWRHTAITRQSHRNHMAIAWQSHGCVHGNYMAITRRSHGDRMAITWQSHGDRMATTWQSHGNHMDMAIIAITWGTRTACRPTCELRGLLAGGLPLRPLATSSAACRISSTVRRQSARQS